MYKKIEIIMSSSMIEAEEKVNEYLVELYKEGLDSDDIEILCNTVMGPKGLIYNYTIIYLEQD